MLPFALAGAAEADDPQALHATRENAAVNGVDKHLRVGLPTTAEPAQIRDLSEYVLNLSGRSTDPEAVGRATQLFADNCSTCHGADGKGNRAFGAPNLTDADWLYGGDKQTIIETITKARSGVMPSSSSSNTVRRSCWLRMMYGVMTRMRFRFSF